MNRFTLSIVAVVVLFATAVVRPSQDTSAGTPPSSPAAILPATANTASKTSQVSAPPQPDENPYIALCAHFQKPFETGPDACPSANLPPPDTRYLIVSVPDPERTHLTLEFDRIVESIRRGAEDSGYSLDLHWFPWEEPEMAAREKAETDTEKKSKYRQDRWKRLQFPGLMLFRPSQYGEITLRDQKDPKLQPHLVVLLVGETPVSGIDRIQFAGAVRFLAEAKTVQKSSLPTASAVENFGLLAPSFSGSIWSLKRALLETGANPPGPFWLSATATSLPNNKPLTALHGSEYLVQQALVYFQKNHFANYDRMAIVSEADTDYGAAVGGAARLFTPSKADTDYGTVADREGTEESVLNLRFPKDISQLRNAFEDDTRASTAAKSGDYLPGLIFNLKDVFGGRDSIPVYSKSQTALAQDSLLNEISANLRRRHVQLVGVTATDTLDTYFVLRFLKDTCPDIRFFSLESDILFARPNDRVALEGTLAVTTYPLIAGVDDWGYNASGNPANTILFDSSLAQAQYNSFRILLGRMTAEGTHGLPGFERPLDGPTDQPPIWITAVGRNRYYPVAALPLKHDAALVESDSFFLKPEAVPEPKRLMWKTLFWLSLAANLTWFVLWFGSRRGWFPAFTDCLSPSGPRAFCLAAFNLTLAAIQLTVAFPAIVFIHSGASDGEWWLYAAFACLMAVVLLVMAARKTRHAWNFSPEFRSQLAFAWLLFAVFCVVGVSIANGNSGREGFFFAVRAQNVLSAVSPLLPFLFLLPVFAVWAWVALQRRIYAEERPPVLPGDKRLDADYGSPDPASRFLSDLAFEVDQVISWEGYWSGISRGFVIGATFCLSLVLFKTIRSLEPKSYDCLFAFGAALGGGLILLTALQAQLLWRRFKPLLDALDLHPIRGALALLPADRCWSPLWVTNTRRRSFIIVERSLETTRLLTHLNVISDAQSDQVEKLTSAVLNSGIKGERPSGTLAMQTQFAVVARKLEVDILYPKWREGSSQSLTELSKHDAEKKAFEWDASKLQEERKSIVAGEFVAFRYVAYIRYVLVQLRNLISFVSTGFVLMAFSLICYPFLPQGLIGWMLGALFVLLAVNVIHILAQLDRDSTMSRLTNTEAGKLGWGFYLRVASIGLLPFITLVTAYFPALGRVVISLAQPALQTLK